MAVSVLTTLHKLYTKASSYRNETRNLEKCARCIRWKTIRRTRNRSPFEKPCGIIGAKIQDQVKGNESPKGTRRASCAAVWGMYVQRNARLFESDFCWTVRNRFKILQRIFLGGIMRGPRQSKDHATCFFLGGGGETLCSMGNAEDILVLPSLRLPSMCIDTGRLPRASFCSHAYACSEAFRHQAEAYAGWTDVDWKRWRYQLR